MDAGSMLGFHLGGFGCMGSNSLMGWGISKLQCGLFNVTQRLKVNRCV
jgi:hypothetical protein